MRLTADMRHQICSKILQDVPTRDHQARMRTLLKTYALKKVPEHILSMIGTDDEVYLNEQSVQVYDSHISASVNVVGMPRGTPVRHGGQVVPTPYGNRHIPNIVLSLDIPTSEYLEIAEDAAQDNARLRSLGSALVKTIAKYTTAESLARDYPEWAKYIPEPPPAAERSRAKETTTSNSEVDPRDALKSMGWKAT